MDIYTELAILRSRNERLLKVLRAIDAEVDQTYDGIGQPRITTELMEKVSLALFEAETGVTA